VTAKTSQPPYWSSRFRTFARFDERGQACPRVGCPCLYQQKIVPIPTCYVAVALKGCRAVFISRRDQCCNRDEAEQQHRNYCDDEGKVWNVESLGDGVRQGEEPSDSGKKSHLVANRTWYVDARCSERGKGRMVGLVS
jgi:hypothetical protein